MVFLSNDRDVQVPLSTSGDGPDTGWWGLVRGFFVTQYESFIWIMTFSTILWLLSFSWKNHEYKGTDMLPKPNPRLSGLIQKCLMHFRILKFSRKLSTEYKLELFKFLYQYLIFEFRIRKQK